MAQPSKWSQNTLMTTRIGTAISAPMKPHSHDQKATAMKIDDGIDLQPSADDQRRDQLALDDVADEDDRAARAARRKACRR